MKKICLMMAVALMAAAACSKNEADRSENNVNSFSVKMVQPVGDADTKTAFVLDNGKYNKLVWSAGDKLYVTRGSEVSHDGTKRYATYTIDAGGSTEGTFSLTDGEIPEGSGKYLAFYTAPLDVSGGSYYGHVVNAPTHHLQAAIPSMQTYVENGIQQYGMPMYGVGDDLDHLTFYLLGNVLRFNLYNGGSDVIKIKSIKLSTATGDANNGIAGSFAFDQSDVNGKNPVDAFGIWATTSVNHMGTCEITYSCGSGVALSTDSANPTVFNTVVSRRHSGGDSDITARFTFTVNDGTEQYKDVVLTNLTQTKRAALGKIYSFPAKDASTFFF